MWFFWKKKHFEARSSAKTLQPVPGPELRGGTAQPSSGPPRHLLGPGRETGGSVSGRQTGRAGGGARAGFSSPERVAAPVGTSELPTASQGRSRPALTPRAAPRPLHRVAPVRSEDRVSEASVCRGLTLSSPLHPALWCPRNHPVHLSSLGSRAVLVDITATRWGNKRLGSRAVPASAV